MTQQSLWSTPPKLNPLHASCHHRKAPHFYPENTYTKLFTNWNNHILTVKLFYPFWKIACSNLYITETHNSSCIIILIKRHSDPKHNLLSKCLIYHLGCLDVHHNRKKDILPRSHPGSIHVVASPAPHAPPVILQ